MDTNCKSIEHRHEIDFCYSEICKALHCSSLDSILSSKSSDCRDYIVPGFNDYVKDLHSTARSDYVAWRDAGKPRSGAPCSNMRRSRLKFKYALRQCKRNEHAIRSDQYANPANSSVPKLKRSSADFRMLFQTSEGLSNLLLFFSVQLWHEKH